jgi:hypothetical protein
MADISKLSGIDIDSIAKMSGVDKASMAKFGGISKPASGFSNTKSLDTDGVNDYFEAALSSDIVNTDTGSISFWVKLATGETGSGRYIQLYENGSTDTRIEVLLFYVSGTPQAKCLTAYYRSQAVSRVTTAKTESSFHGMPMSRNWPNYGDFGAGGSDYMYQYGLDLDSWHHIVFTWDTGGSFTYGGTTYNGVLKLYFDGVLVDEGQSTVPGHRRVGVASSISAIPSSVTIDRVRVGASQAGNSPLDGLHDEYAIFNSVLSSTDVSNIYNSGTPADLSSYSNLIGWWKFDGNGNDSSSNSNNGSLYNGASYSSTVPT